MPPKRKAVKEAEVNQITDSPETRSSIRIRIKQLQAAAEPVRDAGHLETRAMSSAPKQNAARKRGPWGEEYLMTNPKSVLVHADLVRLFSNPKAWECLEEDEKRELLSLLPAHIHPNPDPDPEDPDAKIPPLPESFLRYDNNWRAALRHFQSDLESGRYRPEWQKQARQAVQERQQGEFDDFKEQEFEQFWGQKQKINYGLIAGESSKVKLETLIQHNVVRVGDVWKYCRVFSAKNTSSEQTVVEKEAKITATDGTKLSFLVPTGRRVFLCNNSQSDKCSTDEIAMEVADDTRMHIDPQPLLQQDKLELPESHDRSITDDLRTTSHLAGILDYAFEDTSDLKKGHQAEEAKANTAQSTQGLPMVHNPPVDDQTISTKGHHASLSECKSLDDDTIHELPAVDVIGASMCSATESLPLIENGTKIGPNPTLDLESNQEHFQSTVSGNTFMGTDPPETAESLPSKKEELQSETKTAEYAEPLEIEVQNIAGPNALTKKVLELDGRIKNPPNGNAWKEFRCYRNNQDMGSLWELRQAWYIKFQQG